MPVTEYTWNPLTDSVIEETDGAGNVLVEYVNEPSAYGPLISQHRDGESRFFHFDALGSTRALTDADGNVTDTFTYDAWGNEVDRTGVTETPFRWVGQWGGFFETLPILNDFRRRSYAADIARFCSQDTLYPEVIQFAYMYAQNSPCMLLDPSGYVATDTNRFTYIDHYVNEPRPGRPRTVWSQCALQIIRPTSGDACSMPFQFSIWCRNRGANNPVEPRLAQVFTVDVVGNSGDGWRYIVQGIAPIGQEGPQGSFDTWWRFALTPECAVPCSPDNQCEERIEMYFISPPGFRAGRPPQQNEVYLRLRITGTYSSDSDVILNSSTSSFEKRQAHGIAGLNPSYPRTQSDIAPAADPSVSLCLP